MMQEKDDSGLGPNSHNEDNNHEVKLQLSSRSLKTPMPQQYTESSNNNSSATPVNESTGLVADFSPETRPTHKCPPSCMQKSTSGSNGPVRSIKNQWGRTSVSVYFLNTKIIL